LRLERSHNTLYTTRSQITPQSHNPHLIILFPPLPPIYLGPVVLLNVFNAYGGASFYQGLVGSVFDMDWESPVPQAASLEGRGEGTYTALVGFPFGSGLDFILDTLLPFASDRSQCVT
jgi:hypothetical protein